MKLELTADQHRWIDNWLHLWGAWAQTGKIDKSMINMIAKFMATVEGQQSSRPMCSDDDGMLIDAVLRHYLKTSMKTRGGLSSLTTSATPVRYGSPHGSMRSANHA